MIRILSNEKKQPARMGELLFWQREKDSTSAAAEAGSRGKRATGTFSNTAPVRILSNVKKQPARMGGLLLWQREKDSKRKADLR